MSVTVLLLSLFWFRVPGAADKPAAALRSAACPGPLESAPPSSDIRGRSRVVTNVRFRVSFSVSEPDGPAAAAAAVATRKSSRGPFVFDRVRCRSRSCCIWRPASATVEGREKVTVLLRERVGTDLSESLRGRAGNAMRVSGELDTVWGVRAVVGVVIDGRRPDPRTVVLVIVLRRCEE